MARQTHSDGYYETHKRLAPVANNYTSSSREPVVRFWSVPDGPMKTIIYYFHRVMWIGLVRTLPCSSFTPPPSMTDEEAHNGHASIDTSLLLSVRGFAGRRGKEKCFCHKWDSLRQNRNFFFAFIRFRQEPPLQICARCFNDTVCRSVVVFAIS